MFITIQEDVPFPIIPNICFLNLPLVIIRTVLKKVKDFFSTCSVNQGTLLFTPFTEMCIRDRICAAEEAKELKAACEASRAVCTSPVSYTHLDVYKRQSLVSLCMKIMSVLITVILYGRMIEIYLYCSVSPIPFATMTNREWGQIGNNYLKSLFALGFQGFLIMICVGIYAVLVNSMIIADNLHSAIFSLAAYTVILCFSLFKSGALAKSIFSAH